jgi:hypothetical protein
LSMSQCSKCTWLMIGWFEFFVVTGGIPAETIQTKFNSGFLLK